MDEKFCAPRIGHYGPIAARGDPAETVGAGSIESGEQPCVVHIQFAGLDDVFPWANKYLVPLELPTFA